MKIGFLNRGHATWTAGSSYTRSMVEAMASACPDDVELCLIGGCDATLPEVAGVTVIRSAQPQPAQAEIGRIVAEHAVEALLPVTEIVPADLACGVVGWIPDFQHSRLPHYFTAAQRAQRDGQFQYLVENCDAMMFSSEASRADFEALYPGADTIAATVPFPSSFAYDPAPKFDDPARVVDQYGLPAAYALVINQFWRHKNHRLVVEAVARVRARHPDVFVVMAGTMSDSRDPSNASVSALVQRVFREKLSGNLALLGEVPGNDLLALLRGASLVVQPSEFEGWNTTVEDALAFGKRIACSDLEVHREQAPGARFFGVTDADALAECLAAADWGRFGWEGAAESAALETERGRGREWGARAIDLCRRAASRHLAQPGRRPEWRLPPELAAGHPTFRLQELQRRCEALEAELAELKTTSRGQMVGLREELARARGEAGEATKKYWRERQKPLRVHLREAICGRRD